MTCSRCGTQHPVLTPWEGQRLCEDCLDARMGELIEAMADIPVTVGRGVQTPGHVTRIDLRSWDQHGEDEVS
jgi:hypothetical protein